MAEEITSFLSLLDNFQQLDNVLLQTGQYEEFGLSQEELVQLQLQHQHQAQSQQTSTKAAERKRPKPSSSKGAGTTAGSAKLHSALAEKEATLATLSAQNAHMKERIRMLELVRSWGACA